MGNFLGPTLTGIYYTELGGEFGSSSNMTQVLKSTTTAGHDIDEEVMNPSVAAFSWTTTINQVLVVVTLVLNIITYLTRRGETAAAVVA